MDKNKTLVVGPNLELFGGVAFLLSALMKFGLFEKKDYFMCDSAGALGYVSEFFRYVLCVNRYDVVHLNPSLEFKSTIRDLLYAKVALLRGKKVILSWMGWSDSVEDTILSRHFLRLPFLHVLNSVDRNVVSNELFKNKIRTMGVEEEAVVIYPPYDSSLNKEAFETKSFDGKRKLLFLARLEKSKGIENVFSIFEHLHMVSPKKFQFTIAGDGAELENIKKLSKKRKIPIEFTGYVKGSSKISLLKSHDVFVYPSLHAEGFPLILADVMKAGLFLVVSDAGGIPSVISSKNGNVLSKFSSPVLYAESILEIDALEFEKTSSFNIKFSNNFSPANIVDEYTLLYKQI